MKLYSGKVLSSEVKPNRDLSKSVQMVEASITSPEDVQTIERISRAGEDSNPVPGTRMIIGQVGRAWKIVLCDEDDVEPSADPGDKYLYSTASDDATLKKAEVKLYNDGRIEISNDATSIRLDPSGSIDIESDTDLTITSPETTIESNVTINGDLVVNGSMSANSVEAQSSLVVGGIEMLTHIHTAPSGGGPTSPPQPG